MANVLLAFQNRIDEATLSNGTWSATLPLTNLQSRLVQKVARSTAATLASTKMDIALAAARNVGVVSLIGHNISVTGKVRITGDDDAGFTAPLYQSAWISVWPSGMIPQDLLEWEDDNFWLGTLSQEARAAYQSPFIHILPTPQSLRYWRVEVDDTGNSAGYVQIGRVFLSNVWRPTVNYSLGAELVYKDVSPIETSLSGAEYFDVRGKVREFSFSLDGLTETEAYDYALQLQRVAGVSGEILQIPDTDDTTRMPARAYVGRLTDLQPIGQSQNGRFKLQLKVRELV